MRLAKESFPLQGKLLFCERQKFRELPFILLPLVLQLLFFWGLVQQLILGKPWGTKPSSDLSLILINLLPLTVILFLFSVQLVSRISEDGISVKHSPFHRRWRVIPWTRVQSVKLVKYDGIRDYYGYGIRYSRNRGWCYTVSGTDAMEIFFGDKTSLLIGTHQPKKVGEILKSLNEKQNLPVSGK